mmetsp:Transcript_18494/g.40995  ORF Transcript_18494/g.40995 Transcript_18494/m.40995 type:complete len:282 (-) Transcript_18494:589-1434(-)
MSSSFTSGRLATSRWRSSPCAAARVSLRVASGRPSLQAAISLASSCSSVSLVMSTESTLATDLKWGISNTAPDRPGHRFIPCSRSRTFSRYSLPSSAAPHSSWVVFVAASSFSRLFSKVVISLRTPTSSCWACRTLSMRSERSWWSGGRAVSSSACTVASQVSSLQVASLVSTNSSMVMYACLHASSSFFLSFSHSLGPNVTVESNFCSLTFSSDGTYSFGGSWDSCRADSSGRLSRPARHSCSARELATTRRVASAAPVVAFMPNNSIWCRPRRACFTTV